MKDESIDNRNWHLELFICFRDCLIDIAIEDEKTAQ
jgi:hypothetical protein